MFAYNKMVCLEHCVMIKTVWNIVLPSYQQKISRKKNNVKSNSKFNQHSGMVNTFQRILLALTQEETFMYHGDLNNIFSYLF